MQRQRILQSVLAFICWCLLSHAAIAQSLAPGDVKTLMVVLRESQGLNKPDDVLKPTGKMRTTLSDGSEIELEFAWFEFIGDMHIRFVYDDVQTMRSLNADELTSLNLGPPEKAMDIAVANIRRVYGEPKETPLEDGVFQVRGKLPDLDSSYSLDKALWQRLSTQYPGGLVVAVPNRGGLLFAPAADENAVEMLTANISHWHAGSDRLRISSALYLFKDGHWSVYRAPAAE